MSNDDDSKLPHITPKHKKDVLSRNYAQRELEGETAIDPSGRWSVPIENVDEVEIIEDVAEEPILRKLEENGPPPPLSPAQRALHFVKEHPAHVTAAAALGGAGVIAGIAGGAYLFSPKAPEANPIPAVAKDNGEKPLIPPIVKPQAEKKKTAPVPVPQTTHGADPKRWQTMELPLESHDAKIEEIKRRFCEIEGALTPQQEAINLHLNDMISYCMEGKFSMAMAATRAAMKECKDDDRALWLQLRALYVNVQAEEMEKLGRVGTADALRHLEAYEQSPVVPLEATSLPSASQQELEGTNQLRDKTYSEALKALCGDNPKKARSLIAEIVSHEEFMKSLIDGPRAGHRWVEPAKRTHDQRDLFDKAIKAAVSEKALQPGSAPSR